MQIDSGLAGKVALVSGGSRGIGRAIVELFAGDGMDVVFFYRDNAAAANEVVAAVQAAGGRAQAVQADVGDAAAVARPTTRPAKAPSTPSPRPWRWSWPRARSR